jgi:3-oxoacyl-[acyl-carrier-protein] synthase II
MRVAVTGLGAISGAGAGVAALFELLCQGRSAVRPLPALAPLGLSLGPMSVALPPGDDGQSLLSGEDRATPMALHAAAEAMADAGLEAQRPHGRLGLTLGTTLGAKGPWLRALAGAPPWPGSGDPADWSCAGPARVTAARFGAGAVRVVSTACASGNAALGSALQLLRRGRCDVVLAGSVDALQDFVIAGFGCLRAHAPAPCQPFDRNRRGLNLGEGAGFMVLEPEEHARRRGARVRAYLDGCGLSADATHMTGPDREGGGAGRAMRAALAQAGARPEDVDFVSLHGTATVFNDLMEARALHAVLGPRAAQVPVNSIKGSIGHTLGASGLLEAILCVRALETGFIPPTAGHVERDPEIDLCVVAGAGRAAPLATVLSTSSGFGGLNSAVVLRRGSSPGPGPGTGSGRGA